MKPTAIPRSQPAQELVVQIEKPRQFLPYPPLHLLLRLPLAVFPKAKAALQLPLHYPHLYHLQAKSNFVLLFPFLFTVLLLQSGKIFPRSGRWQERMHSTTNHSSRGVSPLSDTSGNAVIVGISPRFGQGSWRFLEQFGTCNIFAL